MSNVAKSFGVDQILTQVDFRLEAREKVALVGRNGTGKTTLLKIITGQLEPDRGSVHLSRGAKIGYLRQEAPVAEAKTVLGEAEQAVQRQLAMRSRLTELEARIAREPTQEDLDEFALLHEHFLEAEGYSAERDLRTVLQRMGFDETELEKPTSKLSGGEKTRLAIARLLLEEPDLLILDEPTNHLDLQATEWLEGWIRGYHGAVLLVSHDRTFLENTAERVLDLRDGEVKSFPGPFEKYLRLRAEYDERQAEVARRQQMEIDKMDEYVRRFINSQRTAQARGRQKLMNRLIESKVEAPREQRGMKAGFGKVARSGDIVLEAEGLGISFGDQRLFTGLDWTVRNGERWGVIGENGAGKSTLVKLMLGLSQPTEGRARLGSGVVAGYFSQDAQEWNLDQSPLDMMVYELDLKPPDARNLLGRFLIVGDDVFRPIRTLSGGEKNKLSLARLAHLSPNLLVLDEPTNHLDMASREALVDVLKEYKGTLVLVSHDRHLLAEVTDHTLDLRRTGPVLFGGSYTEYRNRGSRPAPATQQKRKAVEPEPIPGPGLSPRELSKEIQRVLKLVEETEQDVESTEQEIRRLEALLSNLPPNADVFELTQRHQALQENLEGRLAVWEAQSTRLEELRAMQS